VQSYARQAQRRSRHGLLQMQSVTQLMTAAGGSDTSAALLLQRCFLSLAKWNLT
jgi:hypothetical protein